jgi:resuscitation-promoting factor RpfB
MLKLLTLLTLFTISGFWAGVAQAEPCDPNYEGACVPIASDVDCAGGSGNGPAYVRGPVYVVGRDIYKLDRDGDGVACEK